MKNLFFIIISCFITIASAKTSSVVKAEHHNNFYVRIHPDVVNFDQVKNLKASNDYEKNFQIFNSVGDSFFNKYYAKKKFRYEYLNMINFDEVEIEKPVTVTFLPPFNYDSIKLGDDGLITKKSSLLNLLLIKFF